MGSGDPLAFDVAVAEKRTGRTAHIRVFGALNEQHATEVVADHEPGWMTGEVLKADPKRALERVIDVSRDSQRSLDDATRTGAAKSAWRETVVAEMTGAQIRRAVYGAVAQAIIGALLIVLGLDEIRGAIIAGILEQQTAETIHWIVGGGLFIGGVVVLARR